MNKIFLILILTGCSSFVAKPLDQRITQNTLVSWTTVDDVEKTCVDLGAKKPVLMQKFLGCAIYNAKTCHIITAKSTSMETLGHELRHCFEGSWHDR